MIEDYSIIFGGDLTYHNDGYAFKLFFPCYFDY